MVLRNYFPIQKVIMQSWQAFQAFEVQIRYKNTRSGWYLANYPIESQMPKDALYNESKVEIQAFEIYHLSITFKCKWLVKSSLHPQVSFSF